MIATLLAAASGSALGVAIAELLDGRARRRLRRVAAPTVGGTGVTTGTSTGRGIGALADDHGGLGLLVPMLRLGRVLGPAIGRRLPAPTDAARRLDAAGLAPGVTVADLGAVRGAGVVVGLAGAAVAVSATGGAGIVLLPILPVSLMLLPDLVTGRRIRRRATAMLLVLPDTIDLLRIVLRSGRSVPEALARVGAHHPGDLGTELRRAAAEVRLGVPTERALIGLRRRCPADGSAELVALLLRAHHQGGAVTDGLQALADDLRARRARSAIDRASRAAPKVQLVVALLLVPAAMLLIAAALLQLRG